MKSIYPKKLSKSISFLCILCTVFLCPQVLSAQSSDDLCNTWRYDMDTTNNLDFAMQRSLEVFPLVDDSCKAQIYYLIGDVFLLQSNSDSAIFYMDKGMKIAEDLDSDYLRIKALIKKASAYLFDNNVIEAKLILAQVRSILIDKPGSKLWLGYYHQMSTLADINFDYQGAINYIDSTIQGNFFSDSIELANSYHNLGLHYYRLSNYSSATESLLKALEINSSITGGDIASNYLLLGYAFGKWEQYDQAIFYLKKSIGLSRSNNNELLAIRSYTPLASNYRKIGKREEALNAVDSSIYFLSNQDNPFELSKAYLEKGKIYYYLLESPTKAKSFYSHARAYAKQSVTNAQFAPNLELVKFHLDNREFRYAKSYLQELESICTDLNRLSYNVEFYKVSSAYHELLGNETEALDFYKKYHMLNDSIANKDILSRVAGMEKKYDTKEKELNILKLSQEKKEQAAVATKATLMQKIYAGIAVLLSLIVFSTFFFAQKLKKQKGSLEIAHHKLGEINGIKDRLFSIIAHDVRGMIIPFQRAGKVLSYHLDKGNHERAITLSQELEKNSQGLSTMLDNLLKWSLEQMDGYNLKSEPLNIKAELEEIMNGFSQHARFKNIALDIIPSEEQEVIFDKGAFHVIFRNLIGNALKFTEAGKVSADWENSGKLLKVIISDSGTGMTTAQQEKLFDLKSMESDTGTAGEKGTGLGLHLVHQFTAKLNGQIKISSKVGQGSQFVLTFPQP